MHSFMKALRNLTWLTQTGLSIAMPLVLCVLGSTWLRNRFELGGWVVILGIFLGIGGAVSGLWSTFKSMQRHAEEDDREAPISFNDHV